MKPAIVDATKIAIHVRIDLRPPKFIKSGRTRALSADLGWLEIGPDIRGGFDIGEPHGGE
jgi:hypothetical protein